MLLSKELNLGNSLNFALLFWFLRAYFNIRFTKLLMKFQSEE